MENYFQLNMNTDHYPQSNFKYAMLLEYDGANFAGSQCQPDSRTVQQELETALERVLRQPIRVVLSGRTDTGVNASGQVAHFELNESLDVSRFTYSLNGVLPVDIAIRAIETVDHKFNARKSALKRWYRYTIYNNIYRTALNSKSLHIYYHLDEDLMNQALKTIIGIHDFDSFKSSNTNSPFSNCHVHLANCFRERDYVYIDIIANRFVYNMVRIIVGTLLKIGNKQEPTDYLIEILEQHDRTKAGITVRPEGLTLMAVEYPEEYKLFNSDLNPKVKDIILKNFTEAPYEDLFRKAS